VDARAIVERIWPGRGAEVDELGGGITNRNFKVSVDGETYVLRVGGKDTDLLGIDRDVEHAASRMAADLGIGPGVVRFVEPEGWLVTRFVPGRPIDAKEMRGPDRIRTVAAALRRIHAAPAIPGRFDSFRVVETYRDTAAAHGVSIPDAYERAHRIAGEIEGVRGEQPLVPCHNDLLNANFIEARDGIRIVDWEYAGMGDRFFDLANFAVNHELDDAGEEALLAAYFGDVRGPDLASLRVMRFMSDFREAMWGVVQQGISELDFDFVSYAAEHFERLERTASDPRFRAALAAA
jgi:thiamine kinase-like enzyme